jgi:hypothetical protein
MAALLNFDGCVSDSDAAGRQSALLNQDRLVQ